MSSINEYYSVFNPTFLVAVKSDINSVASPFTSDQIVGFEFDEDVKKADMLKLTVLDPSFTIMDSGAVDPGNLIDFSFGFYGGHIRPVRTHIIYNLEPDFTSSGQPMFYIYAYDFSMVLGGKYRGKNWGKVSRTDVAESIAGFNGLQFKGDPSRVLKNDVMQPPALSDMQFLLNLAKEINYACYIEDATLFFVKKGTDQKPPLKVTYRNPDGSNPPGTLLSFKPHLKLHNRPSVAQLTDGVTPQAASQEDSDQAKTAPQVFDLINNLSGATSIEMKPDSGAGQKSEPQPIGDNERAAEQSQAKIDAVNMTAIHGTIEMIGEPLATKNIMIEVAGVGQRFSGLWFVENAKHTIKGTSQYMTRLYVMASGPNGTLASSNKTAPADPTINTKKADDSESVNNLTGAVSIPSLDPSALK